MKSKIFLTLVSFFAGIVLHAQPVKDHGQLHVDGINLKDAHDNNITLRGMSFGWHCFHPRFYNAGAVGWLHKDWDCSVVRAAMGVEPKNGYVDKPEWSTEKVKAVVDGAIKEGIYVIIDFHSHNIKLDEAKKFFKEMATAYGRYPNVIYEIFNEPDQETWDEVKAYSNEVMTTIRKIDPDNIILVGCPHWDQDINLVADSPLTNFTNIMYTVHFYAATHKQELRDKCDYALKKNIPIFISESAGMEASGDGAINYEEWNKWITWAEKNNISWVTWSVSDKDETCSVLLPIADSSGNWQTKDLKESGIRTRELLRKHNAK
ncbi:MAG: glycoside hydrolase family 5 protein [Bacteroidota bacterium]|nr:glycoside hydrolase family 5 protein [Bacteroidota bacterium]